MLFREIITVYCENHVKHINILYGQNTEFLNVEESVMFSNHCTEMLICIFGKFAVCVPTNDVNLKFICVAAGLVTVGLTDYTSSVLWSGGDLILFCSTASREEA
jgi:hypothetical protein